MGPGDLERGGRLCEDLGGYRRIRSMLSPRPARRWTLRARPRSSHAATRPPAGHLSNWNSKAFERCEDCMESAQLKEQEAGRLVPNLTFEMSFGSSRSSYPVNSPI